MTKHNLKEELVQLARDVAPGPSLKEAVLKRLETIPDRGALPSRSWRRITTHPIIRLTAIASILVMLTLIVFLYDRTSSIVLADVLGSIDQVGSYSLQTRMTRTGQLNDTKVTETVVSKVFGVRSTSWNVDPNTQQRHLTLESILSITTGIGVTIQHAEEVATSVDIYANYDLWRAIVAEIRRIDPRTTLLKILTCDHQSIGFSEIDGKIVEGFQTTDPNYVERTKELEIVATVWISTETKLPVRIEETLNWINGNQKLVVSDQFQWVIPLNASDFKVDIPEHYISLDIDLPPSGPIYDPNSAISGLRYYREEHQHYPKELEELESIVVFGPKLPQGLKDEQLREYLRKNLGKHKLTMVPLSGTIKLYRLLKDEERDWAYYGDRVTPDMPDAVLWRWSTPEGMYSVVLGDLSHIEVTKEELKAMEAKLPN
jgi:hypothetical protein